MWGAIIGAAIGAVSARRATNKSITEADKNKWWQQEMSSSAHQREVADLRAAGLNPILSAGGRGASTPGGAMGQVFDEGAGAANLGSASSAARLRSEDVKNRRQERRNLRQNERNALVDEYIKKETIGLVREQKRLAMASAINQRQQGRHAWELANIAEIDRNIRDIDYSIRRLQIDGDFDAATLWSSSAGNLKRRSDMAAQTIREWTRAGAGVFGSRPRGQGRRRGSRIRY
jgi:hypothetical protein